jgi:hypothetical protein
MNETGQHNQDGLYGESKKEWEEIQRTEMLLELADTLANAALSSKGYGNAAKKYKELRNENHPTTR